MRKHLLLFVMMLLPMVASAYDIAVENTDGVIIYYNYINDGKELAVTYNGSSFDSDEEYSGNVVIPQEVTYLNQTYKVTSIDGDAFNGCTALTSVTIPNSVTSTGWRIFRYCSSLTSVTLSNNLTSISDGAFQYCSSLVSITIPNSVTSIGWSAFNKCCSLASITIPNSVTEIVNYAFGSCSSLTSITIGSGISSIGLEAFENCTKLTDIFCYADNVPSTNSDAFKDTPIENVTLHVPGASVNLYKVAEPWKNFKSIIATTGSLPGAQKCEKPSISYKNAQLKMSCVTEGVKFVTDITDVDIKRHYEATVTLTATYNISVYATKSGYDNSDVATATLCWIDQKPATEGIIDGIANVPAKALLIKNNGGQITIEGAADGEAISVYTVNGVKNGSAISQNGAASIDTNLQAGSIAIVKIGDKSVKVVIK